MVSAGLRLLLILAGALLLYYLGRGAIARLFRGRMARVGSETQRKRLQTAATLLGNLWKYLLLALVVIGILATFRAGAIPAVALTTIVGAAIGFGAQGFLRDMISGLILVFEGQLSVGDKVKLYGVDVVGEVIEVGLRTTVLRDPEGNTYFVPNGSITAVKNLAPALANGPAEEKRPRKKGS